GHTGELSVAALGGPAGDVEPAPRGAGPRGAARADCVCPAGGCAGGSSGAPAPGGPVSGQLSLQRACDCGAGAVGGGTAAELSGQQLCQPCGGESAADPGLARAGDLGSAAVRAGCTGAGRGSAAPGGAS